MSESLSEMSESVGEKNHFPTASYKIHLFLIAVGL